MKELFRVILKDIEKENFTKRELIKYGIIGPLVLLAITIIF